MNYVIGLVAAMLVFGGHPITQAYGLGTEGHGGLAVVCRNTDGTINSKRTQVLDLEEALPVWGQSISPNEKPVSEQLSEISRRLSYDSKLRRAFDHEVLRVTQNIAWTPDGEKLPLLRDAGLVPAGRYSPCEIEQLAIYRANGTVSVDKEIYGALGNQGVAAILTHEAIYKLNRTVIDVDRSVESREMTARLFADHFDELKFHVLADAKLPTLRRAISFASPILLRSRSQVFVKVENLSCTDMWVLTAESDVSSRPFNWSWSPVPGCGQLVNKTYTGRVALPFAAHELPYVMIKFATKSKSAVTVRLEQHGQELESISGQSRFPLDGTTSSEFGFLLMPEQ
jgi:hypothetical protein